MSRIFPITVIMTGLFALTAGATGQEKSKISEQHAAMLNQTLRDVIDAGARIFNDNGDHAGCYRMWQGSLMSIRSFVPADMQAGIDKGLAGAEKLDNYADKAFELRKVLDDLRAKTKFAVKTIDKNSGEVTGKVVYEGKPVAASTITLISDGNKFTSAIMADGTFQLKAVPVGDYRVAIGPADAKTKGQALPARYGAADTSGLAIRVQAGKQTVNLELVK
jgi:hypothetical protein